MFQSLKSYFTLVIRNKFLLILFFSLPLLAGIVSNNLKEEKFNIAVVYEINYHSPLDVLFCLKETSIPKNCLNDKLGLYVLNYFKKNLDGINVSSVNLDYSQPFLVKKFDTFIQKDNLDIFKLKFEVNKNKKLEFYRNIFKNLENSYLEKMKKDIEIFGDIENLDEKNETFFYLKLISRNSRNEYNSNQKPITFKDLKINKTSPKLIIDLFFFYVISIILFNLIMAIKYEN